MELNLKKFNSFYLQHVNAGSECYTFSVLTVLFSGFFAVPSLQCPRI